MKKIIIIDSSELLKQYLKEKLERYNFEVVVAKDGFEGLIKIKNELPDLIIMDFYLNRMNAFDVLKEKNSYKGAAEIPVIMLSSKIDRELITKISKMKVFRFLPKPIKIDTLVQAVSELFGIKLEIDNTPCIIDVHLNDDILFIEIASGLNRDKIDILKFKILQIKEIHKIKIIKVLIIFSDIKFTENLGSLLENLIDIVISTTETTMKLIKILSTSDVIKNFLSVHEKYKIIQITNDFVNAMDSFGKIDVFAYGEEIENIKKDILTQITEDKTEEPIVLKFDSEKIKFKNDIPGNHKYKIAIIDDDLSVLEYIATTLANNINYEFLLYENAKLFISDLDKNMPDLIFLDLLMPDMDGFQIMTYLKDSNIDIPIVIITALTQKDIVLKAQKFGVNTFISKPLNADFIVNKVEEILKSNF
jgi:DNA-binding response OmpR family regulator